GKHTYIAGHTVISKDVPPFIKAGRTPISYIGVNSVGLQRRGFSKEIINEILEIYRNIYYKGLNITQALEIIENKLPESVEKTDIITFIKESERGIIKQFTKEESDED
ncbi:MAG TPA: acyl-[acyl-carrier-protein]--UDP-N-acetylglucosamine O-acyltransferase, partial [Ferruginibacter sp.]|nr:acyl-[acyl-carrier-protein]--UDP-N-acetylglucosamine O-acyltransferase [Ferruginibacter sp.]